ncbi:DUF4157 domain-containing protein [Massilia sp. CCM 9029]|nr:DUF4157 domain-containing protein [Massilia sp. CCM 9029]
MDGVRVHYNSGKAAQLNAHAYAQGTDIHIAPGQERHLPHEAWHVVQQAQGRVKPTMQMHGGVLVNDDKAHEHEADMMGAKAAQLHRASADGGHAMTSQERPARDRPARWCSGSVTTSRMKRMKSRRTGRTRTSRRTKSRRMRNRWKNRRTMSPWLRKHTQYARTRKPGACIPR